MAATQNPGALAGATGAEAFCSAVSASNVSGPKRQRQTRGVLYLVTPDDGRPAFRLRLAGREAWTLDRLAEAGRRGVAPIERPAPRWSAYVRQLRLAGVPIDTVREKHGGDFPGRHGRYFLRAVVRRVVAS